MMNLKSLLLLSFLLVPSLALAVPTQIPYTGQLTESGSPVNGSRAMTFVIYDAATAGTALYTQAEPAVVVSNGIYHVTLNFDTSVWTGEDRWLGISVNGGAELTPRTKIGSVPYAVTLTNPPPMPGVNWVGEGPGVIATSTWTEVSSLTITAPADGFLWVSSAGWVEQAYNPASGSVFCGFLSASIGPPPEVSAALAQGPVNQSLALPTSVVQVLPVTAGTHTIKLWARKCYQDDIRVITMSFGAVWLPNRYQ